MDRNVSFYAEPDYVPDNATIRQNSLLAIVDYLVQLRVSGVPWDVVSNYILPRIYSGALPPTVNHVFLDVYNNYHAIASALRQGLSASVRRVAMALFKKKVRYGDFILMFSAMG